jgi:hypothetical protein
MNIIEPDHVPMTQREQLREIVAEACGPIGPYWPMKANAYYNSFVQSSRSREQEAEEVMDDSVR